MGFHITSIPHAMRQRRWLNGAVLLDRWFHSAPFIMPNYGPPDLDTIRMDTFVLTFPRALRKYNELVDQRIWVSNRPDRPSDGKREVIRMLREKGLLDGREHRFGDFNRPVPSIHRDHVNHKDVIQPSDARSLDDLAAALANFSFYVAVAGEVTPLPSGSNRAVNECRVTITEIGVYVRDSFDFNDNSVFYSQQLGVWDIENSTVSPEFGARGTRVTNTTFRLWRAENNRGGDFLVFSDVKRTVLPEPDVFTVRIR